MHVGVQSRMMLALSGADYSVFCPAVIESLRISTPSIFGTEFAFTKNKNNSEKLS